MKIKLAVLLLVVLAGVGVARQASHSFSPQPIKMDESDTLRLQLTYQQAIAAQTQLENALLRAKVKYKVPIEWGYSFETGAFEAPKPQAQPAPPPAAVEKPLGKKE